MLISIFKKKVLFNKLFLLEHIKNGYKFGHVHVKCLMCPYGANLVFKSETCKKSSKYYRVFFLILFVENCYLDFSKKFRSCDICFFLALGEETVD